MGSILRQEMESAATPSCRIGSQPSGSFASTDRDNARVRGEFLLHIFPPDHGGNHMTPVAALWNQKNGMRQI